MFINLMRLINLFIERLIKFNFNSVIYDINDRSFIKLINRNKNLNIQVPLDIFDFKKKDYPELSKTEFKYLKSDQNYKKRNSILQSITFGNKLDLIPTLIEQNMINGRVDGEINVLTILPLRFICDPLELKDSDSVLGINWKLFINKLFSRKKIHLSPNQTTVLSTSIEINFDSDIPINYSIRLQENYLDSGITILNPEGRVEKGKKLNKIFIHASKPICIYNLSLMFSIRFY